METAIDGIIWRADADTLRFHHIEGCVQEVLGYSADEWLAQDGFWQSKLHPDDAAEVISTCVALSRKRLPHRLTYRMIAADGRAVWLQDNVKVVWEGDRAVLSGIMVDVSELAEQREQLEQINRQSAHYLKLYNLVPVAIWEEDWAGVLAELRVLKAQGVDNIEKHARNAPGFVDSMLARLKVLAVNAAAVEMFRASDAQDLISRATEVFEATQPNSVFVTALDAVLAGKRRIEGVNTLRRLDGEKLDAHFRIALPALEDDDAHVIICEMDISMINAAKERFELVTRATTDVIWDFDIVRDEMWASEGLQRIFGLDPTDMQSSLDAWTARIHPDDLSGPMRQFDAILKAGADSWKQEYRFRKGNEEYALVRDEGFILRDAKGEAIRMVGSLVDITEQRRLEEKLRQSQKLEAIGKLTGGMAHDFNNLLTIIMGNLEGLEDHIGKEPVAKQHLDTAIRGVDRSAQLISQLLSYARQRPMAPKTMSMSHQVSQMCKVMSRTLGERLKISIRSDPNLWLCRADPGQFESALLNLCLNARDAMPDGGNLSIRMFNIEISSEETLVARGLDPGRYVVLSVTDSGHGMDEQTLLAAFDPFFTTKEVGAGSGLGLSMVQGFAQQSNGTVDIRSTLGKGTEVKLYLPALPASHGEPKKGEKPCKGRRAGSGHVLLVEDQEMVREHLVTQLEYLGYLVTSATTVSEALALLTSDDSIDLILTDIVLPGTESGLDLSSKAAELRTALPVAFISGYSEHLESQGITLEEGRNFIRKPFRRSELATLLERMLLAQKSGD